MNKTNYNREYHQNVTKRKKEGLEPIRKEKNIPAGTVLVPFYGLAQVCRAAEKWN